MEDPNRVVEAPDGSVWRHGKGAIEFGPDGLLHIPTSAEAIDGQFCGLAVDEDLQPDQTEERVLTWASELKRSMFTLSPSSQST